MTPPPSNPVQSTQAITETDPPLYIRHYAVQLDDAKKEIERLKTWQRARLEIGDLRMERIVELEELIGDLLHNASSVIVTDAIGQQHRTVFARDLDNLAAALQPKRTA